MVAIRSLYSPVQLVLIAACTLSMQVSAAKLDETFEVTRPLAGDIIAVSYSDPYASLPIEWTVPESIANRTIFISLVQDNDLDSLMQREVVNGLFRDSELPSDQSDTAPSADTASNNGSYTWRGRIGNSLFRSGSYKGAPSGCNYSISLRTPQGEAFSPYFTLFNVGDGGLARNASCPLDQGRLRPGNSTNTPLSTGTNVPNVGGVSSTTLAVAVAVPIAVLLLAFGLGLWLAVNRRWLVRPGHSADRYGASRAEEEPLALSRGGTTMQEIATPGQAFAHGPSEMHGYGRPAQVGGTEVYQLPAGEVRR
ncbi:hypothetical protein LTR56_010964 [Elasticomyces elasticus]|nr:hypothetical protein LTR56_010964 [Elasticomyces elasticus]KAK3662662.1 hypothetical protein LTR22_006512 [Elasticomyces elasticus]KAK4926554.1 hypothetical protein LTR49_006488 [Elasticomyces elasticus]KAK5760647.1 hypothetical protein LTS12_009184 [Elasticomyces elasticus]